MKNNTTEVNFKTAKTKDISVILILNKYVRPTAFDRWQTKLQGIYSIEENDQSNIFKHCYFFYKRNQIAVFNIQLYNSPSSEMCKEGKLDDMTHHFIECSGLNNFWIVFENLWNRTAKYQIKLSKQHNVWNILRSYRVVIVVTNVLTKKINKASSIVMY